VNRIAVAVLALARSSVADAVPRALSGSAIALLLLLGGSSASLSNSSSSSRGCCSCSTALSARLWSIE